MLDSANLAGVTTVCGIAKPMKRRGDALGLSPPGQEAQAERGQEKRHEPALGHHHFICKTNSPPRLSPTQSYQRI